MTTVSRGRVAGALACLSIVLLSAHAGSAGAQSGRSVTLTPADQLIDGQYIDVSWQGFTPGNDVRARLCPADADSTDDCAQDTGGSQGDSKVARTGTDGKGSTPFVVRAGEVLPIKEGSAFLCDTEHPCRIFVFELDFNGNEVSFGESGFAPLGYALSSIPCPDNPNRIAGVGATTASATVIQWQSETCRPPLSLNVSFATTNSINGKEAFVEGLADSDFAVSGIALNDEERAKLTARKVRPVQTPITLGSLAIVYNLWYDTNGDGVKEQIRDLHLSPATLTRILQGRISNWADAQILADNPQYRFTASDGSTQHRFSSKLALAIGRADNSAATWWLSSWLIATAKDAWEEGGPTFRTGPTAVFPAENSVSLRTGSDAVAEYVRTAPGQPKVGDIPESGLLGYVYLSEAQKLGLPVVALQNAAGAYVKPTEASVLAGLRAGTIDNEGVFAPNFQNTDATAYPVPVVSYAITSAAGEAGLDAAKGAALKTFLEYATTTGQDAATVRGFAKLPTELSKYNKDHIDQIVAVPTAPVAATTPSPNASSTPAVSATPVESVLNGVVPGLGTTLRSALTSSSSAGSGGGEGPAEPAPASGPLVPVKRTVSGVIRLLDGAPAPVTVPSLVGLGLIALIAGRAAAVLSLKRRAKTTTPSASVATAS